MKGQMSSEKGSLLPQFSCHTLAKLIRLFSDIQNQVFDLEVAALDTVNFELSYILPRSETNLYFVVFFIFLGDMGKTK